MSAMIPAPPDCSTFKGGGNPCDKDTLDWIGSGVSPLTPKTMITSGDACIGENGLGDGRPERFATKWDESDIDDSTNEYCENTGSEYPVDALGEREFGEFLVSHVY